LATWLVAASVLGEDSQLVVVGVVCLLLEGELSFGSLVFDIVVFLGPVFNLLLLHLRLLDQLLQLLVLRTRLYLQLLVLALDRVE